MNTTDDLAITAIRSILAGNAPDGIKPVDCGAWGDKVQALYDAHSDGGTPAVRSAFDAMTKADPGLAQLLASGGRKVTLHHASEAWEPRPEIASLVADLIHAATLVMLVGPPGVGKTWIFLALAVCVASGQHWLNRATSQVPVLLIDEESGARRLADRLERTMRGYGLAPGSDLPLYYTSLEGFSFRQDDAWLDELVRLIGETGAGLVIIDALADVMLGGDENAVKDTQPVFHNLRTVSERTGATILVIHHTNKAGGYRGSTAIPGALDLVLQVSHVRDTDSQRVETIKSRDMAPTEFTCRFEWDSMTNSFRLGLVEDHPTQAPFDSGELFVLRYLSDKPNGAAKKDIEDHADTCGSGTARNAIYSLVGRGLAKRVDDGGPGSRAIFALTEKGLSAYQRVPNL